MENSVQLSSGNVPLSSRRFDNLFLRKIRGWIPSNFWQEAKLISRLAGPVCLTELMTLLISIVSSAFCGHLGKIELDAVSLATATTTVLGTSIGVGLSAACDTLLSQTFGSKNLKRIGVILQRGILILLIACFPCWAFFINTEHILLALKQSPAVAKLAQNYAMIFIPGLPAAFLYVLEVKYLQNQGIILPQIIIGFLTNILNAVINYVLLFVLMLGVPGSAAANVISQYCQVIFLFVYIRWKKLHEKTWEGLINEVQLGAQSIIFQTITIAYRVSVGYSVSATVHVGKALGGSNPQQAVNYAKVAIYCDACICLINAVILGAVRSVVGYVFTSDKEIVQLAAEVVPLSAVFHLFDSVSGVCGGVLRGAGKQKLGAIGNLVGYYLIGFPIGITLMFAVKLGVFGLWCGMLICVLVQLVFFLTVIYRINWNKASDEALVNAGVVKDMDTANSASGGQMQDISTEVDTGNCAMNPIPSVCQSELQTEEDQVMDTSSIVDTGVTTVGEILSTKQLIIRRGLAFLSGPLILAIGLMIHFILAKGL
ncbi:multidrug and toxin extrusion protein 1-like isoform X3 [Rhincodon typus]|uniref:multidrug and toxin extrusion protein 1-like isoform X3 n=1 Tax=Rhincodon typus TaxID=259920 RepID=UPI00202DD615|nr:multidrug and toxin extrusion protein 1-like isoform X3 [Rhincodon typus]